jgi:hypothetical protein
MKALPPLPSLLGLKIGGMLCGGIVGANVHFSNSAICPGPAPDFGCVRQREHSLGSGETMSDSVAIDHTGRGLPVSLPKPSHTGSLYPPVVNGPGALRSASVMRLSHLSIPSE